jgi:glycosyltransferase involved in cell wall biosynthesis
MNNLKQLIEKSRKTPALAPIYAMELDRQLRGMAKAPLTFSAKGLADEATETARALGLDKLFDAKPTQHAGGAIYQAEMLAKEGKRSEAIVYAFANAQGPEINALNLLYANHSTTNLDLRLYFLNKYLAAYGQEIELEESGEKEFFHRIQSKQTPEKVNGPLVTVIMPAHNAEGTIDMAVGSLLKQTWQNLQIILVDDASTDGTLQKAKELANRDSRIEVLSTTVNVGPYVCRNLGVMHTRGQWLTVHDADDWAFPDRIEQQVNALTSANALVCTGRMVRINEQGQITRPIDSVIVDQDGYLRLCFVSLMVPTAFFINELGGWDTVRVGGDAEMVDRLEVLGVQKIDLCRPLMLCLDNKLGLTNHPLLGLLTRNKLSNPLRADYQKAFKAWHKTAGTKKLSSIGARFFEVPKTNLVNQFDIDKVFRDCENKLEIIKTSEIIYSRENKDKHPEVARAGTNGETKKIVKKTSDKLVDLTIDNKIDEVNKIIEKAKHKIKSGNPEDGVELLKRKLPKEFQDIANLLDGNNHLEVGDEPFFLQQLNIYLGKKNISPIKLRGNGTFLDKLVSNELKNIVEGPLISVMMTTFNSSETIGKSLESILCQTWRNLELIIVDDSSIDNTWNLLQNFATKDDRIKIIRNKINVGTYVSKNIALMHCKGEWITCQDADDWSFPQRIEQQHRYIQEHNNCKAVVFGCIKISPTNGRVLEIGAINGRRTDGICKPAAITGFFNREFFQDKIGYWDSSRFGADSELFGRIRFLIGDQLKQTNQPCMFYMDTPNSLTNNSDTAFNKIHGLSPARMAYRNSWNRWHQSGLNFENVYFKFPQFKRNFPIPQRATVPLINVLECLK